MRAGEFADALAADLHLDAADPYLHLRDTKNGRPHEVRLFGVALEAMGTWASMLQKYCEENPRGLLWPGPRGARRSTGHWWGKVGQKGTQKDALPVYLALAGVTRQFRTHDTRHTCGTALVSGEWGPAWTLEMVKEQFNHSDIGVTQRYAKAGETALKKAARLTLGLDDFEAPVANLIGNGTSSEIEKLSVSARFLSSGPAGTRTRDLRIKRAVPS